MNKVEDKMPVKGQLVIAYTEDGSYYLARYTTALTWAGRKLKFINMNSNGFWHNDVVGWNRLPMQEDTL